MQTASFRYLGPVFEDSDLQVGLIGMSKLFRVRLENNTLSSVSRCKEAEDTSSTAATRILRGAMPVTRILQ